MKAGGIQTFENRKDPPERNDGLNSNGCLKYVGRVGGGICAWEDRKYVCSFMWVRRV